MVATRPLSQSIIFQQTLEALPGFINENAALIAAALATTIAPIPLTTTRVIGGTSVGTQLTASVGLFTGGPTLTYQWHRNGVPIPGAITFSYTLTSNDLGFPVGLTVTATNNAGSIDTESTTLFVTAASSGNNQSGSGVGTLDFSDENQSAFIL